MSSSTNTPTSLKVIFGFLLLIFVLKILGIVLGGNLIINLSQLIIVGAILVGMYFRSKIAYYVFYIFITISIYGTLAIALIQSLNTKGKILSDPIFLVTILFTLIPLVVIYKLMGRDEVKMQYEKN